MSSWSCRQQAQRVIVSGRGQAYQLGCVQVLGQGGPGDWLTTLQLGQLAAFVYDEPIIRYLDATTGCDLRWVNC